jgi:hypothetical protein
MKDFKQNFEGRDYNKLFEDLRAFSKERDITFTSLSFVSFWHEGEYIMNEYGLILHNKFLEST